MKLLFKENGRVAYTVEGDCAIPEGMTIADAPEDFAPAFLPYYKLTKTRVVLDTTGFPDVEVIGGVVVPSMAAKKSRAWEEIKAKRGAIKAGGVKVGTKWYHTDTDSRIQHLGLLEKARAARAAGGTDVTRLQALGQDIKWKTMDGSFIYLTVKHAEDIFAAVADLDAAAFAAAETHRVAMEASADPAAYDFSVGWPATFAG